MYTKGVLLSVQTKFKFRAIKQRDIKEHAHKMYTTYIVHTKKEVFIITQPENLFVQKPTSTYHMLHPMQIIPLSYQTVKQGKYQVQTTYQILNTFMICIKYTSAYLSQTFFFSSLNWVSDNGDKMSFNTQSTSDMKKSLKSVGQWLKTRA